MKKMRFPLAVAAALLAAFPAFADGPLKSGLDGKAPPFAMPKLDGSVQGLTVDFTHEIGKRLGREVTIEAMSFSALVPALQAGTFDFLSVPFTISAERAEGFLLTEGIWGLNLAFMIKTGGDQITDLEQLRGKVLATNQGNIDDLWARENAEKYGWSVESYGSLNDAAQAVQAGRAAAAVVNDITGLSIAASNKAVALADLRIDNKRYFSYAIPKGSEALRVQIETAIECIKADGTAAELYEKWLGAAPAAGSLTVTPQPGIGPEGYANFDPNHSISCN